MAFKKAYKGAFRKAFVGQQGANLNQSKPINLIFEGHSFVSPAKKLVEYNQDKIIYDTFYNSALSGSVISGVESRAATVDTKISGDHKNLMYLWIGVNDLNVGTTANSLYSSLETYMNARVAAGWEIIVCTCMKSTSLDVSEEAERVSFNTQLNATSITGVNVYDPTTIAALDDPSDTTYYADGLHFSDEGNRVCSDDFSDYFDSLYSTYSSDNFEAAATLTVDKVGTGLVSGYFTIKSDTGNYMRITTGDGNLIYTGVGDARAIRLHAGVQKFVYAENAGAISNLIFSNLDLTVFKWTATANAPSIGGDISPFSGLEDINVGVNTMTGSISEMGSLTSFKAINYNEISGDIKSGMTYINNTSSLGRLSGDIGLAAPTLTYCLLNQCAMDSYTAGAAWGNFTCIIIPATGYGYSSTDVDNMLIDMANSGNMSGKTITITGASEGRTSASDSAVATLQAAGCTVNAG